MRRFVTGVKDGRASMVEVTEPTFDGASISGDEFIAFPANPPAPRPPGKGAFLDLGVKPGEVKWLTINFPPNVAHAEMHHTDTIDCHTIVAGSVDLILDDGAHRLVAGDSVIVTGVDHAWQAGGEGCTSSILVIGTPPPE